MHKRRPIVVYLSLGDNTRNSYLYLQYLQTMEFPPKGSTVRLKRLGRKGQVLDGPNQGGEVLVQVGGLRLWVSPQELEEVSSQPKKAKKSKNAAASPRAAQQTRASSEFLSVDLHGMTRDQAVQEIEALLDRALLQNCAQLEIIHGIGSGALQQSVHAYLAKSKHVAKYMLKPGNPGTTLVYL